MIAGIHKVCPSEQELSVASKTNLSCPVAGCGKIIFNSSALKMHVIKVHKVYLEENDRNYFVCKKKDKSVKEICHYHCPMKSCVFNIESCRFFNSLKLLKQHFMKVHAEKKFKCSKCGNAFGMINDCQRHEQTCGIIYTCSCSCPYSTKEALLTHAKRKQHMISPQYFLQNIKKRKPEGEGVVIPMKVVSLVQLPQPSLSKIAPSESISPDAKVISSTSSNLSSKIKPRWILPKPPLPTSNMKPGEHNSAYLSQSRHSFEVIKISTGTQTEQISRMAINSVDTRKGSITSGSLNISKGYEKRNDRHYASDKLKSGNSHKKSIAQTQTSGDYILKKAMASANLILNKESRGAQCSPAFKSKSIITESAETQTAESHLKMATIRTKLAAKCSKIGPIPFSVPWSTPFLDDFGCSDNETQTVDLWPELEALLNQQSIATLPNIPNTFRDVDLDSVSIPRSTSSTQTSLGNARLRTLNDIQTDTSDFDILALVNSSHFPKQHQVSTIASNNNQVSGDPLMPIDSQSNFTVVNLSCFMDKNNSLKSMSSHNDSPSTSSLDDLLDSDSPISESTFYSHIETQTNEEALAYDQILMNMETQTTDEYLFPDLESVDIETQTRFVNLNTVETQTHVHALVSQSLLSTSTDTQTQTLLQELDLGGTELMDNHTQTTWSYLQDLVAQLEDNYIINSKN